MRFFQKRTKIFVIMFLLYVCLYPFLLKSRYYQENLTSSISSIKTEFVIEYKKVRNHTGVRQLDLDRTYYNPGFHDHVDCHIAELDKIESTICGNFTIFEGEKKVLGKFLDYVKLNPNWLVLDIGSKNGMFSLFSAKLNHTVLTVEPFYDNILETFKVASMKNILDKMTIIQNIISDVSGDQKRVHLPKSFESMLASKYRKYPDISIPGEYDIKTIELDDLVHVVPRADKRHKVYKQTIMKVDIDGHEPYAFSRASKLLSTIDVNVLFTKWDWASGFGDIARVENMISFLNGFNLKPFDMEKMNLLYPSFSSQEWRKWPKYVLWKKDGF